MTQSNPIQPSAQGDGDPGRPQVPPNRVIREGSRPTVADRPFDTHGVTGPVLVHVEKRGPFVGYPGVSSNGFLPMTVAQSLGASLVAQTSTATGHVFNAIQRKCLLDLMPAWSRLLRINGITVNGQSRTALRRDWFWGEAFDAIVMALVYCETEHARVKWLVADMVIRGEAAEAAENAERTIAQLRDEMRTRHYVSAEIQERELQAGREMIEQVARNLDAYRAFAEGRA